MQKIHLEEPGEGYWENMFPLYGKAASTLKKLKKIKKNKKNWYPLAGLWFVFKNECLSLKTKVQKFQYVLVKWKTTAAGSSWLLSKKMEDNGFHYLKS